MSTNSTDINPIILPQKEELIIDNNWIKIRHILKNTKKNLVIHGKAGTGKSSLLNDLRYYLTNVKKVLFTGSTGISALNISGSTIHSVMGINHKNEFSLLSEKKMKRLFDAEIIMIDEMSMIRADTFDLINGILRYVMGNKLPFGGKQIVLVGDMYQLGPVVIKKNEPNFHKEYETPYFFSRKCFDMDDFEYVELKEVHRQKNGIFTDILKHVRVGKHTNDMINVLNSRLTSMKDIDPKSIIVATKNERVKNINNQKLSELPGEEFSYIANIKGDYPRDIFPAEEILDLKLGCRVMILMNGENYANGELGVVLAKSDTEISILKDNEIIVNIKKNTWEITERLNEEELEFYIDKIMNNGGELPREYISEIRITDENKGERILGTFEQFPITLGYAVTIHKSQGKTFDKIVIDLGYEEYIKGVYYGAFCDGQIYVALSRCRSLEGIQLLTPIRSRDVMVNINLHKFIITFRKKEFPDL